MWVGSELRSILGERVFLGWFGWWGEKGQWTGLDWRLGLGVCVGGVCHSSLCESKLWRTPERLTAFVGRIPAQWLRFNGR